MKKKKNNHYKPAVPAPNAPGKKPWVLGAVLVGTLVLAIILAIALWPKPNALEKDFTVYDASGKEVQLSDFVGKPIVLNFWASWCPPCKAEMPDFQKMYDQYGKQVHFLMVNLTTAGEETYANANAFLKDSGYTFPVYFDRTGQAGDTYQVYSMPTTFFIDSQGNVASRHVGMLTGEKLLAGIQSIT